MRAYLYDTLFLHIAKVLELIWNWPKLPNSTFDAHVVCEADVVNVFTDNFWLLQQVIASCHKCITYYRVISLHVYTILYGKEF